MRCPSGPWGRPIFVRECEASPLSADEASEAVQASKDYASAVEEAANQRHGTVGAFLRQHWRQVGAGRPACS